MTTTLHSLFAKKHELRAAERAIIDNPLFQDWESKEYLMLQARLIEIQNELESLYYSEQYIDAMSPSCIQDLACYGGI